MVHSEDQGEWLGQNTDFGEKHMQVEHRNGKLGCTHGLELFLEGERSIFVTGLETKAMASYLVSSFDEIRFNRFDVSGCREFQGLLGFEVSQGEDLRSVADEGRFKFISDKALASPTEGVVFIGEGGR